MKYSITGLKALDAATAETTLSSLEPGDIIAYGCTSLLAPEGSLHEVFVEASQVSRLTAAMLAADSWHGVLSCHDTIILASNAAALVVYGGIHVSIFSEPAAETPEDWTEELGLFYPHTWHIHHTGGGCMVVTSNNYVINEVHKYIGITSDCACIYVDNFDQETWLMEPVENGTFIFGYNPIQLLDMLKREFTEELFDVNQMFDDIYAIAKSGKC